MARGGATEIEGILYGRTSPRASHVTPFTEDARRVLADNDFDAIDQGILLKMQQLKIGSTGDGWISFDELFLDQETDASRYTILDSLEQLVKQDLMEVESGGVGELNLRWKLTPLGKAACGLIAP